MKNKVITRFPPSPTGYFHIGSARTALFNYLFAKQNGGEFVLRFEDTDKERSKKEFEKDIVDGLAWLGIISDREQTRQSERVEIYKKYLKNLIDEDHAYTAEKSELGEGNVIRFKNPNTKVSWDDLVRGEVTFDTVDLGDFVIARSMDEPLYHLAVVVDDAESGITHVIRGEDHISNTPRQILIAKALGFAQPIYAHIPLILGSDRSKLSKRKDAVSVNQYRREGYLPEAFVNYLALLGWHPKDEQEFFALKDLLHVFDLSQVQKGGAIFDKEKLAWINRHYMGSMPNELFIEKLLEHIPDKYNTDTLERLLPLLRERLTVFSDVEKEDIDFFYSRPAYEGSSLIWKDADQETTKRHLMHIRDTLKTLVVFKKDMLKEALWKYASEEGRGAVLWPLRYALSGLDKSPDPFEIAEILGQNEVLARIEIALEKLSQ